MGHEVTVLTVTDDETLPRREQRDGYRIVRRRPTATVLGNELSVGVARFLREASGFDVVHAHSHLYFSTNVAAVKRRLGGTPLAITNHGLYSQSAPEWMFERYLATLGRWTFDAADVVFCYTEEDKDRLREFGVGTDVAVVPNGVDTERFTPEGPQSDKIDHDGPVILFIGRLVEGKRPRDAIGAVARLPAEVNAHLYVVGDGPLREGVRSHAESLGAIDRVTFLGRVPYDEMPAVYRAGDLLLLPSRAEGLPRTVLEAFASGIPVVSSYLPHTAPIVETGGETVQVGDVEGYAATLERVLADRSAPGEAGRQLVLDDHRWRDTTEATTERLESLRGEQ